MKINIKKLDQKATIPSYAKPGDAGMDITTTEVKYDTIHQIVTYHTGLSLEVPEGHLALLMPRSSIYKTGLTLSNSIGLIDSGYRGELLFKFKYDNKFNTKPYEEGDRIGQLVIIPYPTIEFNEVKELGNTERGTGGFGSTDKK